MTTIAAADGTSPRSDPVLPQRSPTAIDPTTGPAPAHVNSVLWNLSSPAERGVLLAQAAPAAAQGGATCTVELRYNPVALGANHAFVVTTDADSQNFYRGGPTAGGPGSGSSGQLGSASGGSSGGSSRSGSSDGSGSSNASSPGSARGGAGRNNGPWGPIVTDRGAYRPGTIDWNPDAVRQTVEVRRGSCDARDAAFARAADRVEASVIPYNPLSTNSNATARTILESAGIRAPDPSVWAPGYRTELPLR